MKRSDACHRKCIGSMKAAGKSDSNVLVDLPDGPKYSSPGFLDERQAMVNPFTTACLSSIRSRSIL